MSEEFRTPEITPNHLRAGKQFYENAMGQLDLVIHGEEETKAAYLGAALARENLLLVSVPGSGKSVMLFEASRIFGEPGEHDIKRIPPQSDLQGKQLTGGSVTSTKTTETNGVKTVETTTTEIEPILHKDVRIIVGDEVNRVNPYAIGAMLEGLESGRVITSDGIVTLGKFMFSVMAINPPGTDKHVHDLSSALISRNAIGTRMGENANGVIRKALEKKLSRPEKMEQIATYEDLEHLQRIAEAQLIPGEVIDFADPLIESAHDLLSENGVPEGKGRLGQQITRVSSALSVLKANRYVEKSDIYQATQYAIQARLGARNRSTNVIDAVMEHIQRANNVAEADTKWFPIR